MASAAALVDDLVAEILLHLPPHDPSGLVRASLACKSWRRLLTDPAFLRRYREFHREPPLLGFFHNVYAIPCFIPTTMASPWSERAFGSSGWRALDCRHGRVLLDGMDEKNLLVWDPITGDRQLLHAPDIRRSSVSFCAAVMCTAGGCDHLNCHSGPFMVVFLGSEVGITQACVYSSEGDAWSVPASVHHDIRIGLFQYRGVLIGDDVFFNLSRNTILKYDLGTDSLSMIDSPAVDDHYVLVCGKRIIGHRKHQGFQPLPMVKGGNTRGNCRMVTI
ncbi:hypothetical protein PR202_ga28503 [Eleusine coracana subsp. coracana]|uniref:F-box domain-containing protein n=1 Tax=Eleusine coracana subsp. coracana TaxID=191504 RepID=A0AAV5DIQ9_ELECO|nr:hypothetical protein PR202_ga28503 [Eleusine coracana subsp. coracana]